MASIFTKIINREIPGDFVYEDETVAAFLDINPVNKGHVLVVPKRAFNNIFDGNEEIFAHMAAIAMRIGNALKKSCGCDGVSIHMNNVIGQDVPHAHIHVIPRYESEKEPKITWSNTEEYAEGESAQIATQIAAALEA